MKTKSGIYAGIGSRETPDDILLLMEQSATILARKGFICSTGAAIGADQACANGALLGGGNVHLHLPWKGYNSDWSNKLVGNVSYFILQPTDSAAYKSVEEYHPAHKRIVDKRGPMALHARNYNILFKPDKVDFIICWTRDGKIDGGTGQALRIAADNNIRVYNLGILEVANNFKNEIKLKMV